MFKRLKQRLFRLYLYCGAHIHVHHWRGHGIHSPLVYGIVRNVFMKRSLTGSDHTLYNALRAHGVERRSAILLQNLHTHLHGKTYQLIDKGDALETKTGPNLCIMLPETGHDQWISAARQLESAPNRLVILAPHRNTQRWRFARAIQDALHCVSIDRRTMMIYLFDPKLYKQHYRI